MIRFFSESRFHYPEKRKTKAWFKALAQQHHAVAGNINFIFVDDCYILEINQNFLNHDDYTDIITFDYRDQNTLNSDIYISIERVADNAKSLNIDFLHELHRVMAHGVLHLIGYKDKTPSEKLEMRAQEEKALNLKLNFF